MGMGKGIRDWEHTGRIRKASYRGLCSALAQAPRGPAKAQDLRCPLSMAQLCPFRQSQQPGTGRQIICFGVQRQSNSAKREISFFQRTHSGLKEEFLFSERESRGTCHSLKQSTCFGENRHSLKDRGASVPNKGLFTVGGPLPRVHPRDQANFFLSVGPKG